MFLMESLEVLMDHLHQKDESSLCRSRTYQKLIGSYKGSKRKVQERQMDDFKASIVIDSEYCIKINTIKKIVVTWKKALIYTWWMCWEGCQGVKWLRCTRDGSLDLCEGVEAIYKYLRVIYQGDICHPEKGLIHREIFIEYGYMSKKIRKQQ